MSEASAYRRMDDGQLLDSVRDLAQAVEKTKAKGLSLDMSRGKPSVAHTTTCPNAAASTTVIPN